LERFDRTKLSHREDEILAFAIDGLTDQQIAHKLEISASTVNSYWVRIRGKLGHLSRTELVATALRLEAKEDMERLSARAEELMRKAEERHQQDDDVRLATQYRAILSALPEAILAVDARGNVIFVNKRLGEMFGYSPDELMGEHVDILVPSRQRETHRVQVNDYLADPHPLRVGVQQVVYGAHKLGGLIRVLLDMDAVVTPDGPVTTCIVRSFVDEVDSARRRAAAAVRQY